MSDIRQKTDKQRKAKESTLKVLLINIVPVGQDHRVSLGIASLKAYALQWPDLYYNVDIAIMNINIDQSYHYSMQQINKLHPDAIGFSCFVWNLEQVLHLTGLIKLVLTRSYIILGGPEISPIAEVVMAYNESVDAIVRGFGERPFTEIIRNLLTGLPQKKDIKGIIFRKNKTIVTTPRQLPFDNLNEIPSLYSSNLVPEINMKRNPMILYETSRGCIFNCHFCFFDSQQIRNIQSHSMERIESELLFFMKNGLERVSLVDSLINYDNARTFRMLNFILRNNRKTKFEFEVRGDLLNKESIGLLNELAENRFLYRVDIGLQSIHQKVLNNVQCTLHLSRLFSNISLFRPALKSVATMDLIYGLPGDNYEDFKESLNYSVQELGITTQCTLLQVLPGTHLYENAAKFNLAFDPLPPHYVYSNYTYSLNDIILSVKLVAAYQLLLRGLPMEAFIDMAKGLKIDLVDIFEELISWNQKQNTVLPEKGYVANQLIKFLEEICVRYKRHELFRDIKHELYNNNLTAADKQRTTYNQNNGVKAN